MRMQWPLFFMILGNDIYSSLTDEWLIISKKKSNYKTVYVSITFYTAYHHPQILKANGNLNEMMDGTRYSFFLVPRYHLNINSRDYASYTVNNQKRTNATAQQNFHLLYFIIILA